MLAKTKSECVPPLVGTENAGSGLEIRHEHHDLAGECALFSRYLIGCLPPMEIARRYVRAHESILASPCDGVVAFAVRHPWALPYLDAACGVRKPDGLLRKKLLVLTAILEATPQFADEFLPEALGRTRFVWQAGRYAAAALAKAAVGMVLLPIAERKS